MVWRAIRWRAGSSLVFLGVAIAAMAAASAGPIYLAAANQSVLQVQLAAEPSTSTGYTISPVASGPTPTPAQLTTFSAEIPGGSGPGKRYGSPIITISVATTSVPNPLAQASDTLQIMWRTGFCGQLHFAAGSCPTAANQVALSTRSATAIGAKVGSKIAPSGHTKGAQKLIVSGLYVAPAALSAYWWGNSPFAYGQSTAAGGEVLDAGFVTEAGAEREAGPLGSSNMAQLPFNPSTLAAPAVPGFEDQLAAYSAQLATRVLSGSTSLPNVLAAIEAEEKQMRSVIAVIALELVLLALLVLYGVAATTSAERAPDLAIAELRGLTRRSMAALALREPAVLLLVATPIGLLIGYLIVAAIAPHLLVAQAPAKIDSLAVAAVAATLILGLGASALGARSIIRPTLAGETRAASEKRRARAAGLIDLVVVTLTAVAVAELVVSKGAGDLSGSGSAGSGGTGADPLAALAPALVGLAAGIIAARLLPLASRAVARWTRWSPRVATALACRSVMRRPGVARRALVPTIAVGLLVFSVASFEVARTNRSTQALFSTGAPVVLAVHVAPAVDLVSAVRTADPSGHEAMAVAVVNTSSGNTLAVDSSRFAAVAAWPAGTSGLTASQIGHYLAPKASPPLIVSRAGEMRVVIDLTAKVSPAPVLQMNVFDESAQTEATLPLGTLELGRHAYTFGLDGACAMACRVDNLTLYWTPNSGTISSTEIPTVIESIQRSPISDGPWLPVPAGLNDASDWAGSTSNVVVRPVAGGLSADFSATTVGSPPEIVRNDAPSQLPAVVTSDVVTANTNLLTPDQYPATGLGGEGLTVSSLHTVPALPAVGSNGVMVDLSLAERMQIAPATETTYYVWCSTTPSAGLLDKLRSEGVTVLSTHDESTEVALLDKSGPALAFDLFVLAALAAVLLAVGALVFAVVSGSRKRAVELSALNAVGVPRTTLRRSLLLEYGTVVVVGAVLGLLSGVITIRLALDALPEFVPGRIGPVLGVWVPWGPVLAAAGVALVLLLAGAALATRLVMKRATPESLRVSQ